MQTIELRPQYGAALRPLGAKTVTRQDNGVTAAGVRCRLSGIGNCQPAMTKQFRHNEGVLSLDSQQPNSSLSAALMRVVMDWRNLGARSPSLAMVRGIERPESDRQLTGVAHPDCCGLDGTRQCVRSSGAITVHVQRTRVNQPAHRTIRRTPGTQSGSGSGNNSWRQHGGGTAVALARRRQHHRQLRHQIHPHRVSRYAMHQILCYSSAKQAFPCTARTVDSALPLQGLQGHGSEDRRWP